MDVIAHLFHKFNDSLFIPPLDFGHGWKSHPMENYGIMLLCQNISIMSVVWAPLAQQAYLAKSKGMNITTHHLCQPMRQLRQSTRQNSTMLGNESVFSVDERNFMRCELNTLSPTVSYPWYLGQIWSKPQAIPSKSIWRIRMYYKLKKMLNNRNLAKPAIYAMYETRQKENIWHARYKIVIKTLVKILLNILTLYVDSTI